MDRTHRTVVVRSLLPCRAPPLCSRLPWRPPQPYEAWGQLLSSHLASCRKVSTNPPGTQAGGAAEHARRLQEGEDLLMLLLLFINKSSGYELLSHASFPLMNIAWIPTWLASQPQYLIKSRWNGEVNYALTAVAAINYSSGGFQAVEADIPFLTKLLKATQN